MAQHRFRVGQLIRLMHRYPDPASTAVYEVTRLMPETDGEACYRVKAQSGQERAAHESQMSAIEPGAMAAGT